MSEDQLTAFLKAVKSDVVLQDKLKASSDGEIDTKQEVNAVIEIAKLAGFRISAGDLLRNQAQGIMELSDEELEKVAGGARCKPPYCLDRTRNECIQQGRR